MSLGAPRRRVLPLRPLLAQFRASPDVPAPAASLPALNPLLLDSAPDDILTSELRRIVEAALPVCFHTGVFAREVRFLRHALAHLLRGEDPLPDRVSRCVTPGEAYHISGLGPGFWAVAVRATQVSTIPLWCPAIERGLAAIGLLPDHPRGYAERFAAVLAGCARVREVAPELDADAISRFLERVARMRGRELPPTASDAAAFAWAIGPEEIRRAVREVRTRLPLRKRIRTSSPEVIDAVTRFQSEAAAGNHEGAFEAFRTAFPDPGWETALPRLNDAYSLALPVADRARLWCEVARVLRESFRIHALELAEVVSLAGQPALESARDGFAGFCTDTFVFLGELAGTNTRNWMAANRERYQFVLREPLVELCGMRWQSAT